MGCRPRVALLVTLTLSACATIAERDVVDAFERLPTPAPQRDLASGPQPADPTLQTPPPTPIVDFDALVAEAASRSPAIRAAWYEAHAAIVGLPAARRLPDPAVALMTYFGSMESGVGPMGFAASASQRLPWPSKLARATDAAATVAQVAQRQVERLHAALVRDLRLIWARLARIERAAAIVAEQRELVTHLRQLVGERVATGHATYAELLGVALREEELAERARSLADDADLARVDVRAAASLPSATPIPPARLPERLPDPLLAEEVADALESSPEVVIAAAMVETAEAAVTRAETLGLPDLTFGLQWMYQAPMMGSSDPMNSVMLSVGVTLPVWRSGYDAEVDAASARVFAAQSRREDVVRAAEGQLLRWGVELERERRRVALFEETLRTTAESALTAAVDAYGAGRGSLQAILRVEEQLLGYQLDALAARERAAALAALIAYHLDAVRLGGAP